jgi:hypothetical protein
MDHSDVYAPTLPPSPFVTILVPFDIGKSYSLFSESLASEKEVLDRWRAIFPQLPGMTSGWNSAQFPAPFRKPLNHIIRFVFPQGDLRIHRAINMISWIGEERSSVEAVFFQLGIGVLILRAPLADTLHASVAKISEHTTRDEFRDAVAPLIEDVAQDYTSILESGLQATAKERIIHRLPHVTRKVNLRKVKFPYPVFFLPNTDIPEVWRNTKDAYRECRYAGDGAEAAIYVGWGEAYVSEASIQFRRAIEIDFIIGVASWYALVVMNRHSSFHLLHALAEMGQDDRGPRKQESAAIRFAYMYAANSLYPVLWATQQRDVLLLEVIHETWSSERLWKNIAEQTSLLALHHDHLENEKKEKHERLLELLGLLIASLVFPSAAADVLVLKDTSASYFYICVLGGIAFSLLICVGWLASRRGITKNVSCEKLLRKLTQIEEALEAHDEQKRGPIY